MTTTKEERDARRTAGPLYACGKCHFCGFKVPPKALWCCGECAQDYQAETRQIALARPAKDG